ncbi:MAG TPA: FAD-binding oxidoreductase [Puia sp.]|nr:FAD-binding oxidoreductase [Puia sp.]
MGEHTDVLVVGAGICGTFLSMELERAGIAHVVIDEQRPFTASRSAAGLINPVTGRRIVTTWMIDELLPFAVDAYARLAGLLGTAFFSPARVIDFFPSAQMRLAFLKRLEEDAAYLQLPADEHTWDGCFHTELGYGVVAPCYLVDMPGLLAAASTWMSARGILREERFERGELVVASAGPAASAAWSTSSVAGSAASAAGSLAGSGPGVRYRDITAQRIIFCDGIESFNSPYFSRLPFAPNKGEALIVEIDGLAEAATPDAVKTVFKKGMSLVPWRDGLYWLGSSYEWSFEHAEPTERFRRQAEATLREWVKLPFHVLEHVASVRPATLERRPFVGFHPLHPAVGILNGMGTKGCSLAPFFARQLVQHIVDGSAILPEADVRRFSKILSRMGN